MNKAYVSEFTRFIDQYLQDHPEEVEEQRRGWNIFWHRHVDFAAQKEAEAAAVPDDGYGFHWPIRTTLQAPPKTDPQHH